MESALVQKLETYQPKPSTVELIKSTPILLLVGPSGSGKDSVKNKLLQTGRYHHIISHTTRAPRVNRGHREQAGVEYHFITEPEAEQMLDDQAFIEAKVYSDNLYGTSVAEIQAAHDSHKVAVTDLEVQGVAEYKAIDSKIMAVFLLPPDFETWQARLAKRYENTADAQDMRRRLETALSEIDQLLSTDYYIAVVNADLDQVISEVETIVKTNSHDATTETQARTVAKQLAESIRSYLAKQ